MNKVEEALKAAKRMIDDLAALHWPDMYSYEAVERATQRLDVAAVADTLQLVNDAIKPAPVADTPSTTGVMLSLERYNELIRIENATR